MPCDTSPLHPDTDFTLNHWSESPCDVPRFNASVECSLQEHQSEDGTGNWPGASEFCQGTAVCGPWFSSYVRLIGWLTERRVGKLLVIHLRLNGPEMSNLDLTSGDSPFMSAGVYHALQQRELDSQVDQQDLEARLRNQVAKWQSKLLDLGNRNPLINCSFDAARGVVELISPETELIWGSLTSKWEPRTDVMRFPWRRELVPPPPEFLKEEEESPKEDPSEKKKKEWKRNKSSST